MKERKIKDYMQVCIWILQFYMKKYWYWSAYAIGMVLYAIHDRIQKGDWDTLLIIVVETLICVIAVKALIAFDRWDNLMLKQEKMEKKEKTRKELEQYIIKKCNKK